MRQLAVWLNDTKIGVISDRADIWSFDYERSWTESREGFDLAPGMPRNALHHRDGATSRPVQWYFDNLLPEERLRETLVKEAGNHGLKGDDSFSLLEYLGAESAGSLVLLQPGVDPNPAGGLKPLHDDELCARIKNMARVPLSENAPKRMSLAGAQNKLPVVFRDGMLFEPIGNRPSTHILKPDHQSEDYAGSVINEYVTMRLAGKVGLDVPAVHRLYTPEPVYLVERFDRWEDEKGITQRVHIIDTCQLLTKSRAFKQTSASVETLAEAANACGNKIATRRRLFNWLIFCLLVGNDDNHLKNLSFRIGPEGIELARHYDLLSTATYHTKALAESRARWPKVPMMYKIGKAETFGEVTLPDVFEAGKVLGMAPEVCRRAIAKMTHVIVKELDGLLGAVERQNAALIISAESAALEKRVLLSMRHIVVNDMVNRLKPAG
jgi:serine/threonine-protein kinase HipA